MESDRIVYGWQPVGLSSKCSGERVSIHAVRETERERAVGFSNEKTFYTLHLELVDKVHRLAVSMGTP